jgi:hypothetical protein
MSAGPKSKLTPAEYLAIERKAAFKSEYLNGEMFALAGASYAHNAVKDNLIGDLAFATVPARIPLADIYAGVTFPDTPPR